MIEGMRREFFPEETASGERFGLNIFSLTNQRGLIFECGMKLS